MVEWLLSAVSTENLAIEYINISEKILLEPADKGAHHLSTIAHALKGNLRLNISYQSFQPGKKLQKNVFIEPLALKMFERRWYLLSRKVNGDGLRLYALDRIKECYATDEIFDYPDDFSAKEYFSDFYGVSTDAYTNEPCRVILRAYQELPQYLKAQPLHHSQEILAEDDNHTDFAYWLHPAFDFVHEILSHCDQLEVISPDLLCNQIGKILKISSEKYL